MIGTLKKNAELLKKKSEMRKMKEETVQNLIEIET